jgi:5-methylcytosine-specific restriction endonuclease McrA
VRLEIAAGQKWSCKNCNKLLPATFEIDHIQPLSQGGKEVLSNLQALCPNCHREKTNPERQLLGDKRREAKTGVSKYFDAHCNSYYWIRK